jgi:uncharacterized protein (TIGR03435 family)
MRISRFCLAAALTLGIGAAPNLLAQAAESTKPSFEVASVKPNNSGASNSSTQTRPGGRFTAANVPLRILLREAYRLQDFQLIDAPDWTRTERYDIAAKADGDPEYAEMRLMIQTLLADRFSLVVHNETRELPIYALVVARPDGKLGPQLFKSEVDCTDSARSKQPAPSAAPAASSPGVSQMREVEPCGTNANTSNNSATLRAGSVPMSSLAATLSTFANRVVVDRTGLAGGFDVILTWTPNQTSETSGASLFTALQEQLGLRLESTRGPVEVVVVDRVERPTPD